MDFLIVNSSGSPQLMAALQTCDKEIVMILNQEHQCAGPAFTDIQAEASSIGWSLHGAQAAITGKDGVSAGVAVAVRPPIGKATSTVPSTTRRADRLAGLQQHGCRSAQTQGW